ncbi:MAG: hypothetical protein ACI4PO_01485 [Faecousia sp.]
MKENNPMIQRFQVLMMISIVSLVNSAAAFLPFVPAFVTSWISRCIVIAVVLCLFYLAPVNRRYQKSAIFRILMLGCSLIGTYLSWGTLFLPATSVFSLLAVYQEFTAHSELVAESDPKLSRNWRSLFRWSIALAVLAFLSSFAVVLLILALEWDSSQTDTILSATFGIPRMILDLIYLLYLKKMLGIFLRERESHSGNAC